MHITLFMSLKTVKDGTAYKQFSLMLSFESRFSLLLT